MNDKYDGGNSPDYWDKYWSNRKSHYEKWSMQRAWHEIEKSGARSVLDVGCGNGRLLYGVAKNRYCYGIDISSTAVKHMNEVYGIDGKTLSVYDVDKLDLKFDFIVCNHTLEHLKRDRDALEKIKTRLNPGGTFYCAVPNNMSSPEETDLHLQMYDAKSLSSILTDVFGDCRISILGNHLIGVCKNGYIKPHSS